MGTLIRRLEESDCRLIADAFEQIGWSSHKPLSQYERYFSEQQSGEREVLVALVDGAFAGYLAIVWHPEYEPFQKGGVPGIQDLNVLPEFRRRRIATALMDGAEEMIKARSSIVGVGVGMYADYGNAQRLYVKRGYVPDGRGLTYQGSVLKPMETAVVDDDLVLYFTKELDS